MTLIIALKWLMKEGEAVVVGSDSRATYGPITYEVKKIHPIYLQRDGEEIDLAIAAGAGESPLAKYGYMVAESVLKEQSQRRGFKHLTSQEFAQAAEQVESKLISRFTALRNKGIEPGFQMILTSVDPDGKASIYVFDERGLKEPVHSDPGFAVIGRGAATGGMLLTKLLGYSIQDSVYLDLGMLIAFVIDLVSEVDPTVGPFIGDSMLIRILEGKVTMGPLKSKAIKEYKASVEQRKNLIKLLQKVCDQDKQKEKEIRAYLKSSFKG